MLASKVTVVDYGAGNILSVRRGLEKFDVEVYLASNAEDILAAESIVLPGVGAFSIAMQELHNLGLVDAIREAAQKGTPILGICLGMQLLLDESDEFGITKGLGLIPGRVVPIPSVTVDGKNHKIPHISWNELRPHGCNADWKNTLLEDHDPSGAVYFVHSYMAEPTDLSCRLANCVYGGHAVTAVIARENVIGCQFHPEKSGTVGLNLLQRFLSL